MAERTPGIWEAVERGSGPWGESGSWVVMSANIVLATFSRADVPEWNQGNAELLAEAGNVATKTGRTPRELADERAALIEACRSMLHRFGHIDTDPGKRESCGLARAPLTEQRGDRRTHNGLLRR